MMQCKLTRELEVSPGVMPPEFVASHAVARQEIRNQRLKHVMYWKVGTVFDLPDSYVLVKQGCAIPADDECRERAGMTDEQIADAQRAYEKVALGIAPEDYELYDNGVISGYEADGSYKPGPNFHLLEQAAAEHEAENTVVTAQGDE